MYYIYKIESPVGHVYVGVTRDVEHRFQTHMARARRGKFGMYHIGKCEITATVLATAPCVLSAAYTENAYALALGNRNIKKFLTRHPSGTGKKVSR